METLTKDFYFNCLAKAVRSLYLQAPEKKKTREKREAGRKMGEDKRKGEKEWLILVEATEKKKKKKTRQKREKRIEKGDEKRETEENRKRMRQEYSYW